MKCILLGRRRNRHNPVFIGSMDSLQEIHQSTFAQNARQHRCRAPEKKDKSYLRTNFIGGCMRKNSDESKILGGKIAWKVRLPPMKSNHRIWFGHSRKRPSFVKASAHSDWVAYTLIVDSLKNELSTTNSSQGVFLKERAAFRYF